MNGLSISGDKRNQQFFYVEPFADSDSDSIDIMRIQFSVLLFIVSLFIAHGLRVVQDEGQFEDPKSKLHINISYHLILAESRFSQKRTEMRAQAPTKEI